MMNWISWYRIDFSETKRSNLMVFALVINNYLYVYVIKKKRNKSEIMRGIFNIFTRSGGLYFDSHCNLAPG